MELAGTLEVEEDFMGTITEPGHSSDKVSVLHIAGQNFVRHQEVVDALLLSQPSSWVHFWTLEDIRKEISLGRMQAWVLSVGDEVVGMCITTVVCYSPETKACNILFLSCRKFYTMLRYLPYLQQQMRNSGIKYMEGVVHPTIAKLLAKRYGYTSLGVHMMRSLEYERPI